MEFEFDGWRKIDGGFEASWNIDNWLPTLKIIGNNEGERVYNDKSPIYDELEDKVKRITWRSYDKDSNAFRPYFRDSAKAWSSTGVATFNETFQLTKLGKNLLDNNISVLDVFTRFCKNYAENNELPFGILCSAFIDFPTELSLSQIYFGVVRSYRPNIRRLTVNEFSNICSLASGETIPSQEERKLKLKLSILENVGVLRKNNETGCWYLWDADRAQLIADIKDKFVVESTVFFRLNKPFLLLAGISGTGKSRFVRKQAEASGDGKSNFKLVCVRPDWHEPADLLGYVSRIGGQPEYVATDVLRFMAAAWREAFDGADADGLLARTDVLTPYWLCLDEMNLAPVEQYFADYLSVLETRKWDDGVYRCEPLLTAATIGRLEDVGRNKLRKDLQLEAAEWDDLWQAFCTHGISLPPNLIVAGTVNMDETTHGFSRKVIDRAITLDFGEFFPNDFDTFFGSQPLPVALGYPRFTSVTQADFAAVAADSDGIKTVAFLKAVNAVLAGTPFELAYRALNELLLAVVLAKPADDKALQAVWDDFLMTKVLPRIDGDEERLAWRTANPENSDKTVLDGLLDTARSQLAAISTGEARPDLLRTAHDGQPLMVACRSLKKLGWMQQRLTANRFTSFWP